jgi:biopolymer transport protein ExbD
MIFSPPKKKDKNTFDNALIPLINIIFLLMVFFLVVGRIEATPDSTLQIPQSVIGQAITGKPIMMELQRNGVILLDGKIVQREGLYASLQLVFLADRDNPLTIKADRSLPADYMLSALQLIRRAGGRNVTLVTQR